MGNQSMPTIHLRLGRTKTEQVDAYNQPITADPLSLVLGMRTSLRIGLFPDDETTTPLDAEGLRALAASWYLALDADYDRDTPLKLLARADDIAVSPDGFLVVSIGNTNTVEMAAYLGQEPERKVICELAGYAAGQDLPAVCLQWSITVCNRITLGDGEPPVTAPPSDYYTAAQVRALLAAGLQLQFSPDGAAWHEPPQLPDDLLMRLRYPADGAEWSPAIDLPRGVAGDTGPTGPAGQRGETGATGATGPTGPVGPGGEGAQGPTGDSAYDEWLAHGNSGSTADFLDSLRGPTGPQGPEGPQGPPGMRGQDGAGGETGPAGPQGDSAYEVWRNLNGNAGLSEEDFMRWLRNSVVQMGTQETVVFDEVQIQPRNTDLYSLTNVFLFTDSLTGSPNPLRVVFNPLPDFYSRTNGDTFVVLLETTRNFVVDGVEYEARGYPFVNIITFTVLSDIFVLSSVHYGVLGVS